MRRYFARKLVTYILTFFVAVTVDWMIPRFMPGNPVRACSRGCRSSPAQPTP